MRVLQILPELNVGGVETGTVDFAKYLVRHHHHSVVVSNGGGLVEQLEKDGSRHYTLPVHKKSLVSMIALIRPLREIIEKERINIVHARSRVPAWIAYFACRKTRAAFITTCHGCYNNRFFSQVMGWSKLVIVPSRAIGRHMVSHYGVDAERIRCIPRSVDLERFFGETTDNRKPSRDRPATVAIVGRLTPIKGHKDFIKAMVHVVRRRPDVRVWIIGDAPARKQTYRQELEKLTRRYGLSDHVHFLGSRNDVPRLLRKVDVLVMASVVPESFGRVILEAQAVGVPVVATRVGGVVDIIDHEKTGLLVMPRDTDAMAAAVTRLLNHKSLRQAIVQAAREKLQKQFTLEHMARDILKVYREILGKMNILVIKISSIGDVVLVTASLRALRHKFPKARICCLVGKEARKVLQRCPYIDELIVADFAYKDRGWLGMLKVARRLRRYHFDRVLDFQNNRRSHMLAFLSGAKESYGYDNGKWGGLLSHPLPNAKTDIEPVRHQFQLLNQIGIHYTEKVRLELWPSHDDRRYVDNLLEGEWLGNVKNIVGINLAASEKWATKNWPVEHIAGLCDLLARKNIRVVVTGMAKDLERARRLLSLTTARPAILIGKTDILQLAALIDRCRVFVTPDSAPMHVAAAMGVPFVALFGPTAAVRHLPPASKRAVIQQDLTCSPCYRPRCKLLTNACLRNISPEEVLTKIVNLMGDAVFSGKDA